MVVNIICDDVLAIHREGASTMSHHQTHAGKSNSRPVLSLNPSQRWYTSNNKLVYKIIWKGFVVHNLKKEINFSGEISFLYPISGG